MKDAKYGPYVNQYIDYYGANIDSAENYPVLTFNNIDKELSPIGHTLDASKKEFLQKIKKQNLALIKKTLFRKKLTKNHFLEKT